MSIIYFYVELTPLKTTIFLSIEKNDIRLAKLEISEWRFMLNEVKNGHLLIKLYLRFKHPDLPLSLRCFNAFFKLLPEFINVLLFHNTLFANLSLLDLQNLRFWSRLSIEYFFIDELKIKILSSKTITIKGSGFFES